MLTAAAEVRVGPMLRYVGETTATVWVETDRPCRVEVLGHWADTFEIDGHHFALVCVEDLDPTIEHPYEVALDGTQAWPPRDYEYPQPRIRLMPSDGRLRLLFGSCRASAPQRPPYTHNRWRHSQGEGIDALHTFATRMLRQPSALWPDVLLLMGDQIYADEVPDHVAEVVAGRTVHADGPVHVLEDFEEYCVGYWDAWTEPTVRWMLSTVPTSMMFDDHEINDKWNISQYWLTEIRQTSWYQTRIIGGLMSYWVYQHIGNRSPEELAKDATFQQICETRQGSALVRDIAERAESDAGLSHFSFCRDFGPARLIMMDARTGRQLAPGQRQIMTDDEWQWVESKTQGRHEHLILASSVPFLLPYGLHYAEAWAEAVGDAAWGHRWCGIAERVRLAADLDHWACFQHSYRAFEDLVIDVATGRCGEPPASVLMLGGDVHHCWVSEVSLPDDAAPTRTRLWQVVCSGLRKDLPFKLQTALRIGHSRFTAAVGRVLIRTARVQPPRLRWAPVTKQHFRNQIGTLEIAGGEVGVRVEEIAGGWRKPRLSTVIEHKLL